VRSEDVIGHHLFTLQPELRHSDLAQAIERAWATGAIQTVVAQWATRWLDSTVYPSEDGVSVFTRDITDRRQTQEKLQRSEERFDTIFQACPIAIVVARAVDRRYILANPEFYRESGYTPEEVIGASAGELDLWADPLEFEAVGRLMDEHGEVHDCEVRFRLKSGVVADAVISVVPVTLGTELCFVTLVRDITSDKHARTQLKVSEERYRRLAAELQRTLDLSLDLIATVDIDGTFVTLSAACQRILGYSPEELAGRPLLDFVHPDDRARTAQEGERMTGQYGTTVFQNRYLHKNGRVVWMEWTGAVLPGERLMHCVARDITARRAAEEDQAFLAAIVHASHDAIFGLRLDDTIRSWNAGVEALYGYTAAEAVGQPVTLLIPPELQAESLEVCRRAGRGERVRPFETVRVARDGRRIPVFVTASPIFDAAGQVIGVSKIARDISERKAAERQIEDLNANLQRQLRHLSGIREIDQMIASSQALPLTLDRILDHARQQLGADAVTMLLLEEHSLELEYAATRGFATPPVGASLRIGTGLAGTVALTRQPMIVPDVQMVTVASEWQEVLTRERLVAYYAAPMIAKGKVLGVMEVLHQEPFTPRPDWLEALAILTGQAAIAIDNAHLYRDLEQRNLDLRLAYDETIEGWARALDLRDKETEGHSRRVTEMTVRLCRHLGVPPEQLVEVRRGALLHDIGKMGIPDAVLLKPGPLTDEEWVLMRQHPDHAVSLLAPIRFLRSALEIPRCHHEKWEGSGYPIGLKGEAIPLTARAFAVVDVYDALTSDRPYRQAWSSERALAHLQSEAGAHFDPEVVRVFLELLRR